MNTNIHSHSLSRRLVGFLAVALGACAMAVAAQAADGLKHSDRAFIEKAAKNGQAEVQISQIATERASNPDVKSFAQMVVSDHQQLNTELAALAATKGVTLPANDVKLSRWTDKKSTEFDKDYVKEMADQHDDSVSLFEKAAKSEDADIAAFAQKYLPKLQAHLTAAKSFKKLY
jgi:putative membrane protein